MPQHGVPGLKFRRIQLLSVWKGAMKWHPRFLLVAFLASLFSDIHLLRQTKSLKFMNIFWMCLLLTAAFSSAGSLRVVRHGASSDVNDPYGDMRFTMPFSGWGWECKMGRWWNLLGCHWRGQGAWDGSIEIWVTCTWILCALQCEECGFVMLCPSNVVFVPFSTSVLSFSPATSPAERTSRWRRQCTRRLRTTRLGMKNHGDDHILNIIIRLWVLHSDV